MLAMIPLHTNRQRSQGELVVPTAADRTYISDGGAAVSVAAFKANAKSFGGWGGGHVLSAPVILKVASLDP